VTVGEDQLSLSNLKLREIMPNKHPRSLDRAFQSALFDDTLWRENTLGDKRSDLHRDDIDHLST
jgi:hypothetical protein